MSAETTLQQTQKTPNGEASMHLYTGQLPHPSHMDYYKRLYEDAPKIIFSEFQENGHHRRKMESITVPAQVKVMTKAPWIQLTAHITGAAATIATAICGHPWASVAIAFIFASSVVTIYVYGRRKQSEDIKNQTLALNQMQQKQ